MIDTLEEKLLAKLTGIRDDMEQQLFNQWRIATNVEEREQIYAIYKSLPKLTKLFTKSINGDNSDG